MKITTQELRKSQGNNTENNYIDSYSSGKTEITEESRKADEMDTMDLRSQYKEYFEQSLELPIYRQNHPFKEKEINEMEAGLSKDNLNTIFVSPT